MYFRRMNLNRDNYEEFFLLYVDNELPETGRKAVEAFLRKNPDLEGELILLQGTKMKPENAIFFVDKEILLKHEESDEFINENNFQEKFMLYVDDELTTEKRKLVEEFAARESFFQKELMLFQLACIEPDKNIFFEGKEILTRSGKKVRLLPWIGSAAAAVLIIFAGYYVYRSPDMFKASGSPKFVSAKVSSAPAPSSPAKETAKKQVLVVTTKAVDPLHIRDKKNKGSDMETKNLIARNNPRRREPSKTIIREEINPSVAMTAIAAVPLSVGNNNIIPQVDQSSSPSFTADTEDGIYLADASESKNKMRGLFRKVSRVFEKTTSAGEEKGKHSVLIGGFQFALK